MAERDIDIKLSALRQVLPWLAGSIISETDDSVVVQAGGCVVEVPRGSIARRTGEGSEVELTLERDAELVVSTLVSAEKGIVTDNVFGALAPGILANNCNCNCNCDSGNCNCNCNCDTECSVCTDYPVYAFERVDELSTPFRRPFTGGAKR